MAEEQEEDKDGPYVDLMLAREDARSFSRPKTETFIIKRIVARFIKSDPEFIQPILKNLLDGFDNLINEAHQPVFEFTDYILSNSGDISKIVPSLAQLVGNRNPDIRLKATEYLCSVGPLAKAAEDMAMGCLRNNAADIRLCGAKILYSIGAACSRSITRQLRSVAQRYKEEREFCALLIGTVKRINGTPTVRRTNQNNATESQRLNKISAVFKDQRIVLIEDNDILRESVSEMLSSRLQMQTYTAENGAEGIKLIDHMVAEGTPPDYVVLDLKMPDVNGVHVLAHIREKEETKELPVIVVTAVADERIMETIEKLGISSYLKKPFRINDLIKALISNLSQSSVGE